MNSTMMPVSRLDCSRTEQSRRQDWSRLTRSRSSSGERAAESGKARDAGLELDGTGCTATAERKDGRDGEI